MSENLDLVRSIYADWERADFSRADWADPEIQYVIVGGPEPGSSTGLANMAKAMRSWLAPWEDFRAEAEEYREIDDERVLVLVLNTGRGKASGLQVEQMRAQTTSVFHVRADKVVKLVNYFDRDCALADLGLTPEGETP
jgi:ketosteroid isomerase-like protein